jgi:Cytochrome C oxidase, cbb3-type, subunit III
MKISTRVTRGILLAVCGAAFAGCNEELIRQDMANQPKYRPQTPSDFFADGRSERPLIENTVARGSLVNDDLIVPKDSNAFPLPVNESLLERGEARYKIFCTPCHGLQGDGNGMIVDRGMKRPPSYHIDRMRQEPNGYYYDVITNGFGSMYSYSAQIPPKDRWAIIAYIRVLQLSRNAKASDLPESIRAKVAAGGAESGSTKSMGEKVGEKE